MPLLQPPTGGSLWRHSTSVAPFRSSKAATVTVAVLSVSEGEQARFDTAAGRSGLESDPSGFHTLGGKLVGVVILAHVAWDAYHYLRNTVVPRSYAEFCAVVDLVLGAAILLLTERAAESLQQ